jgi:glycosyltransferase involved in cell wall biosynthesis
MRILMLGWELPPHNSGGLGVASYQICQSLASQKIDIEFILPYRADHKIEFMKITPATPNGVIDVQKIGIAYDTFRYTYQDNSTEILSFFDQVRAYEASVLKLVQNKEFDIVHAHDWLTFRAALRIKELRGCPIILHVHSVESDRAGGKYGNPLIHEIEETSFNIADRIIAVSNFTKEAIMRDYGIPSEAIEVIHNSINSEELIELDETNVYRYLSKLKNNGFKVVTNIGRLTLQKGLGNLLLAFSKVVNYYPNIILLLVGSGEQKQDLIQLAADYGISQNVLFTDFVRGKNWRDACGIGDVFILPSISEPFGLTPLEAISYGTPAIISKQSGVSEVLSNCLKFDYWDIDKLVNQIIGVVSNDALKENLIFNAQNEVRAMSWNETASKIIKVYHQELGVTA